MVDENTNLQLRISSMISEGGIGADAYYFYILDPGLENKSERREAAMVDEGGIGAEIYYREDEKIAKRSSEKRNDGSAHLH